MVWGLLRCWTVYPKEWMNYVIPNVSAQRQADASDDVKYLAIVGRFA